LTITLAAHERSIFITRRGIIGASDTVKDIEAIVGSVGSRWITCFQTELSRTHEIVPLDGLNVCGWVTGRCREGVGEDEGTNRVASSVCAVGIEFSSGVIRSHVDECLVDIPGYLDVIWRLNELNSGECSFRNDTSPVGGLCAPCNALAFNITNKTVRFRRTPKTEIRETVNNTRLAKRVLVLSLYKPNGVSDVVMLYIDKEGGSREVDARWNYKCCTRIEGLVHHR
jgi:hypothetical protein